MIIINRAIVTEKSSSVIEDSQFTFEVDKSVNKIMIKQYLQKEYDITVKNVNTLSVKGKKRRRGRIVGCTNGYKKAIVTLEGKDLEKIKGLF